MSLSATHPKAETHPNIANTIAMTTTAINNLCFIPSRAIAAR